MGPSDKIQIKAPEQPLLNLKRKPEMESIYLCIQVENKITYGYLFPSIKVSNKTSVSLADITWFVFTSYIKPYEDILSLRFRRFTRHLGW